MRLELNNNFFKFGRWAKKSDHPWFGLAYQKHLPYIKINMWISDPGEDIRHIGGPGKHQPSSVPCRSVEWRHIRQLWHSKRNERILRVSGCCHGWGRTYGRSGCPDIFAQSWSGNKFNKELSLGNHIIFLDLLFLGKEKKRKNKWKSLFSFIYSFEYFLNVKWT